MHLRATDCRLQECYCERISNDTNTLFAQNINSISAFSFYLVGLILSFKFAYFFDTNAWYKKRLEPVAYITAVCILGSFSMAMHGLLTRWAELLDQLSLQLYFNLLIAISISRKVGRRTWKKLGICLAFLVFFESFGIGALFWVPNQGQIFLIVSQALIFLLLEVHARWEPASTKPTQPIYLGLSLLFMIFASAIWALSHDEDGVESSKCKQDNILQGHAIWHILAAIVTWFLWEYFASEGGIVMPIAKSSQNLKL